MEEEKVNEGRRGGCVQVVNVPAFISDNPSSNTAEA